MAMGRGPCSSPASKMVTMLVVEAAGGFGFAEEALLDLGQFVGFEPPRAMRCLMATTQLILGSRPGRTTPWRPCPVPFSTW